MRNQKINVNEARVRRLLDSGKSPSFISNMLGYPISVPRDIRDNKPRPYFFRKIKREHRPQVEGKCECCKIRDIAPGFRKLCEYCWKYGDSGEIYPETSFIVRRI